MKINAYQRFLFTGRLYIPEVQTDTSGGEVLYVYEKDINFDFMGDPSTPRSVVVSLEPYPTQAKIMVLKNVYDEEIMPEAEWTVTAVEPIINIYSRVEGYRHQVALSNAPLFGYEDMVRPT